MNRALSAVRSLTTKMPTPARPTANSASNASGNPGSSKKAPKRRHKPKNPSWATFFAFQEKQHQLVALTPDGLVPRLTERQQMAMLKKKEAGDLQAVPTSVVFQDRPMAPVCAEWTLNRPFGKSNQPSAESDVEECGKSVKEAEEQERAVVKESNETESMAVHDENYPKSSSVNAAQSPIRHVKEDAHESFIDGTSTAVSQSMDMHPIPSSPAAVHAEPMEIVEELPVEISISPLKQASPLKPVNPCIPEINVVLPSCKSIVPDETCVSVIPSPMTTTQSIEATQNKENVTVAHNLEHSDSPLLGTAVIPEETVKQATSPIKPTKKTPVKSYPRVKSTNTPALKRMISHDRKMTKHWLEVTMHRLDLHYGSRTEWLTVHDFRQFHPRHSRPMVHVSLTDADKQYLFPKLYQPSSRQFSATPSLHPVLKQHLEQCYYALDRMYSQFEQGARRLVDSVVLKHAEYMTHDRARRVAALQSLVPQMKYHVVQWECQLLEYLEQVMDTMSVTQQLCVWSRQQPDTELLVEVEHEVLTESDIHVFHLELARILLLNDLLPDCLMSVNLDSLDTKPVGMFQGFYSLRCQLATV